MPMSLFRSLFPGDEPVMSRLRDELFQAISTPGLTTVLLQGPPGTGKTTIARAIAAARMLRMGDKTRLPPGRLARLTDDVRYGRPLKWYRDISLAGLFSDHR
ncbi:MAG: AAA family ATPase [Gemmataceae bacterium]|nr:AAA family ATPase [Gemmataceae bacterium]